MKKHLLSVSITLCILLSFISCATDVPTPSVPEELPVSSFPHHSTKEDMANNNLKEILSNNETPDVIRTRTFSTAKPITAKINNDGKLVVTSYAPVLVKKVQIFNGSSPLIHIDEVPGFSEMTISLKETLPSSSSLTVKSSDPFMKKIAKITHPMQVTFHSDNGGPWQEMTGRTSRLATIVALTMSYMFNHEDYFAYLDNWNKGGYQGQEVIWYIFPGVAAGVKMAARPFLDDNGNPLTTQQVMDRAFGANNIDFSLIKENEPAGGIGGSGFLGMREYLYNSFANFQNVNPNTSQKEKETRFYQADVIFHEFGHCMGFYHNENPYKGTMTYGGGWTNVNYRFLNKLIEEKDLPIPLDGQWEKNLGFPSNL